MSTRRQFLAGATATLVAASEAPALSDSSEPNDPLRYVNPMIGCGGHGHCYPGATVPFGMVQLSPDTGTQGWDHCSGYHYGDTSIFAFSHTHISGSGRGDMLDFGLMPSVAEVSASSNSAKEYYSVSFKHSNEHATPGYYSVLLDNGVLAELTASERVGLHRYTFPASAHTHFFLNLVEQAQGAEPVAPRILASQIAVVGSNTITGFRQTDDWASGRREYFVMQFDKPFSVVKVFNDGEPLPLSKAEGIALQAHILFDLPGGGVVQVKTGISGVDLQGARKNLEVEAPGWSFATCRRHAADAWREVLGRIAVSGGTQRQKEIFYTGLYHTMLAPTMFEDADGRYAGMDGHVHQLASGQHNYSTYSLWDTYRALHPLFTLMLPDRVTEIVNCLIRMANQSPAGPPVWPLQGVETGTMTGYHSAVVIAEAAVKKLPGIDLAAAWEPFSKRALSDDYQGLSLYRKTGYIPCDLVAESCSKTTDYCYDDWAMAHLARALGHEDVYEKLVRRSGNYTNLYDKKTTFFRPRSSDGSWAEPFASNEMGHSDKWRDYTESNPWQTTFAVPHDPMGLARLLGGRRALEAKLDAIFDADPELPSNAPPDIAGMVGQYAHGNEPSHHIAYLYIYAGVPHKTQSRIASLCENMYANQPDGIAGNEDCGQMSAWYVLSALGFYPVDPVSGNYVFGTPMFDRATIQLGDGRALTIVSSRRSSKDIYIRSITWNGAKYDKLWFGHADIMGGGTFVLEMGPVPNTIFGVSEEASPPCKSTRMQT
jgi:predicted alpha-1,2-mannosidase